MRLVWPDLKLDTVTLGLIVIAIVPWLSFLLESAELPGGWKVRFRDVERAGAKVTSSASSSSLPSSEGSLPTPSFVTLETSDPTLALVGLRIEIESRLRKLVERCNLGETKSVGHMFHVLQLSGILDDAALSGLRDLISAGNEAAHGARVEDSVARWAIDYGPVVLNALDRQILAHKPK